MYIYIYLSLSIYIYIYTGAKSHAARIAYITHDARDHAL